jgi:hypothetical protein
MTVLAAFVWLALALAQFDLLIRPGWQSPKAMRAVSRLAAG